MGKGNGANDKAVVMERYIAEIDRFATMLRNQQDEIATLVANADQAKANHERARDAVREAKEVEHNTVSLLLKFVRPGSIDVMPLFDQMEPADEAVHGQNSTEWRTEPISVLNLSALATRALIDADIVLVGQLQDRVRSGDNWAADLAVSDAVAQAIEAKLFEFIEERKDRK